MKDTACARPWYLYFTLMALLFASGSAPAATSEDARAVARLYSAAFDRAPEPAGLNFWIRSLDQGQTLLQLAQKFRSSPEFIRRYGDVGNEEFVRQLYRNILGRPGEASGVAFWVETLESGSSQAQVLRQFSQSPENRRKTDDLFAEMHRGADDLWTYQPFSGGVHSIGTIDGFGSIFVNGVEFETSEARIFLDGESASEDALRLGMVVTVDGIISDDGLTGTANSVRFDDEVQGPVTALVMGQDGDSLTLTVLGVRVIVERTGTVFEHTGFASLATGDVVEVSGFADTQGGLRATRVEKKAAVGVGAFEVELKGVVAGLDGTRFSLGDFQVDFSGADLSGIPGGVPVEGMGVEVHGTLQNGTIAAVRVAAEDNLAGRLDDDDEVRVEGSINSFASAARFRVNGVVVDGSSALLRPADLVLTDGVVVEAEGNWVGGILVARKIQARRGRVEIEASVASVNPDAGTLRLQLPGGAVSVRVDSRTLLDDDSGPTSRLSLEDIVSGNFLEVEAIRSGSGLLATRIDRDRSDDVRVQAPVTGFTPGLDITLLGVTFSTAGARFESRAGNALTETEFFSQLRVGDLVKIKDEIPADGIADEVEFEREHALDGDECRSDDDCDDSGHGGGSDDPPGDDSGHGGGSDDPPGDDSGHGGGSDDSPGDNSGHGGGSDDPPGDDS